MKIDFQILNSISSVLHSFDYSSFVESFETGKCEFSTFVLFFQDRFDYSGSLEFLYELQDQLANFYQKAAGILVGIVSNPWINLGTVTILIILCLQFHEHEISFHIFRSLKFQQCFLITYTEALVLLMLLLSIFDAIVNRIVS